MAELVDAIDAVLASRTRDEWGALFDAHGLVWGPVLSLHEVVADPHAEAIGLFPEIEHPRLGRYATVKAPMRFASVETGPRGPAPEVGEHSRALLAELGYGEAAIQRLFDAGAVG